VLQTVLEWARMHQPAPATGAPVAIP